MERTLCGVFTQQAPRAAVAVMIGCSLPRAIVFVCHPEGGVNGH